MSKELFIDEWQRIYNDAIDRDFCEEDAVALADHLAYGAMQDRFADMADNLRQRAKDGRL